MIDLEHIHRDFQVGDQVVHALDDINLHLGAGDYVSLMGPSGSGKSTLLNIIGLLDHPTSGTYRLQGRDVTGLDERELARLRNREIGFVFQTFQLVPRMSAAENVELPLLLAGVSPKERGLRVTAALESVGLSHRAHHKPDQLSGGQRQRVAIARATVTRPRVLLADEPTGNLDHVSGAEVIAALEQLNEGGITLVVVTHDPLIGNRARRRLKMLDGRLVGEAGS